MCHPSPWPRRIRILLGLWLLAWPICFVASYLPFSCGRYPYILECARRQRQREQALALYRAREPEPFRPFDPKWPQRLLGRYAQELPRCPSRGDPGDYVFDPDGKSICMEHGQLPLPGDGTAWIDSQMPGLQDDGHFLSARQVLLARGATDARLLASANIDRFAPEYPDPAWLQPLTAVAVLVTLLGMVVLPAWPVVELVLWVRRARAAPP